MKNLLQTILVSILVILVFSLFIIAISIPKPYPISEPCPDDPEGWTDKNTIMIQYIKQSGTNGIRLKK